MNDILISIIENKINESKVEYRKDMKGVIENLYRVTLNEKDKYGFHKNIDIIIDPIHYDGSEDRSKRIIDMINKEFKHKYGIK